MIFDGRVVCGVYRSSKFNVAVSDLVGTRLTWLIKYTYPDKGAAQRRAKSLIPMYGEVVVIPPNQTKKGNHVKRRA